MMDQLVQPCAVGYSPAEIVGAIGIAFNACLLTFLAKRRVAADKADMQRWAVCPFASGDVEAQGHRHRSPESKRQPHP